MSMSEATTLLAETVRGKGGITVLTGAGISAESGIPTFRGPEGFWTVGSREYHPQEMATFNMFSKDPESVWVWYLYRMGLCRQAQPNAGHLALASMESCLGDRFTLITQNVDNLHIRAGSSLDRTYQIHGNIFYTRCASSCRDTILPLPDALSSKNKGGSLTDKERELLVCPACGGWLRPHVLWFDETYDEPHYRFNSALETAQRTRLLITVGTTGATTLPNHIVNLVYRNGGLMIDINVADNPFARVAKQSERGIFIQRAGGEALAQLAGAIDD
ncbi:NAD-dependent protein deacylase [Desulfosarcina widdelii]|uniref:protein acetyllysine N-acetyltransferase n=1 Tax=Desulfosarcina widdelii TaxID=947919 RepID=A0A5K7YX28_9BACT|nr:Sir2 family NAD-dependent protein deacetylase [Desulfosarcina widdelii]BBO72599.1 NAD-dependent protein deacylase [Desulfosarcina widdelii]